MAERIHIAYAKVFRVLLLKSCTIKELAQASDLAYDTILRFIETLRTRPRQIRICDWALDSMGRASIQVFELGTEPDAPRPKPKTGAERMRALKLRRQHQATVALTQVWSQPRNELGISDCETEDSDTAETAVLGSAEV